MKRTKTPNNCATIAISTNPSTFQQNSCTGSSSSSLFPPKKKVHILWSPKTTLSTWHLQYFSCVFVSGCNDLSTKQSETDCKAFCLMNPWSEWKEIFHHAADPSPKRLLCCCAWLPAAWVKSSFKAAKHERWDEMWHYVALVYIMNFILPGGLTGKTKWQHTLFLGVQDHTERISIGKEKWNKTLRVEFIRGSCPFPCRQRAGGFSNFKNSKQNHGFTTSGLSKRQRLPAPPLWWHKKMPKYLAGR